ncbi:hypothetical protein BXY75_3009 [Ulvibacter antarcticus]|uniref:Glycine dehydrogenase n=1 Tax=Ulvibacter antarcticus TaxID=442714 RepID=A0A3L9Y8V4_9FLAO|nr:hypothetical protein BXY75_3009 [Ulvibacter antarcticus]
MSLFMKCEEANTICDKTQYKEATLWEKIKLNIHLIWCSFCRKYTRSNAKLTKVMRDSDLKTMPISDKEALKERLQKEMQK